MIRYLIFIFLLMLVISCNPEPENICSGIICSNHGECATDSENKATCACDEGYYSEGINCIPNACGGERCSGHGQCAIENEQKVCHCDEGYDAKGLTCLKNSCADMKCQENATCISGDCVCNDGYLEKDNKCEDNSSNKCGELYCSENSSCESNACVCTEGFSGSTCESFLIQFDFGSPHWNIGNTIVADKSGNIYVGGYTDIPSREYDLYLTKYSANGERLWMKKWGTDKYESLVAAVVDKDGNIYVTGETEGSIDKQHNNGEADIFLSKFTPDGNRVWTRQFGSKEWDNPFSMVIDHEGFIYISGETGDKFENETSLGNQDIFIIKIDPNSKNKVWVKVIGSKYIDKKGFLAVTKNNDIYLAGSINGTDNDKEILVFDKILIKYDKNGNEIFKKIWAKQAKDSAINGIALDSDENLFIVGETQDEFDNNRFLGESDLFITKFSNSGNKAWTKQIGTSSWDTAEAIAIDKDDNIFISGHVYGAFDGYTNKGEGDLYVMKLDHSWKMTVQQMGTEDDDSSRSMIFSKQNLYITGYWNSGHIGDTQDGKGKTYIKKISRKDLLNF